MKTRHIFKKSVSGFAALAMTATLFAGMTFTVSADSTTGLFDYPTSSMSTDDNVLKGASSQAGTSIVDIMGMDCVSGTTTNPEPSNLTDAQKMAYFGTWGSAINSNPDPWAWNRFYNFYASETEGVDTVTNCMTVSNQKTGYIDTYGTEGALLANRPDIIVNFGSASDISSDLALINSYKEGDEFYQEGDETYTPVQFNQYSSSNIGTMIQSMYALADTMNEVAAETGKTASRYGDPAKIAEDYETFVYGFQSYVRKVINEKGNGELKTVTWLTGMNDDGTYTVTTGGSGHVYEFVAGIANLLSGTDTEVETTGRNGQVQKSTVRVVTEEELMKSDVIILWGDMNFQKNKLNAFIQQFGTISGQEYTGTISVAYPLSTYGMIANTVEIAQGFPFVAGTLYYDLGINPVEWLAYYYEKFYHVTDRAALEKMIEVFYQDASLPDGCSTTLPSDYSVEKMEALLKEGKAYYAANKEAFQNDEYAAVTGLDKWEFTEDEPVAAESISLNYNEAVISTNETVQLEASILPADTTDKTVTWTSSNEDVATVDENGLVTALRYGTATITATTENGLTASCEVQTRYYDVSGSGDQTAEDYQYYYTPVYWAAEAGITKGYDNVYFGVGQECTREDFVLFLYRMAGKPSVKASKANVFTDVASSTLSSSFKKAIAWAVEQGITKGYTNEDGTKTFGVGKSIERKDAIIMLYRYAGKPAVDVKETGFTDVDGTYKTTSDTFKAIAWAKDNKITGGLTEAQAAEAGLTYPAFGCNMACLREQMITFIYRLNNLLK